MMNLWPENVIAKSMKLSAQIFIKNFIEIFAGVSTLWSEFLILWTIEWTERSGIFVNSNGTFRRFVFSKKLWISLHKAVFRVFPLHKRTYHQNVVPLYIYPLKQKCFCSRKFSFLVRVARRQHLAVSVANHLLVVIFHRRFLIFILYNREFHLNSNFGSFSVGLCAENIIWFPLEKRTILHFFIVIFIILIVIIIIIIDIIINNPLLEEASSHWLITV